MKIRNTIIGLLTCLSLFSCKKSVLKTYDGEEVIYFNDMTTRYPVTRRDSVVLSFAGMSATAKDTLFNLPVSIMGKAAEKDRYFKVRVNEGLSTAKAGLHYDALPEQVVFKAGSVNGVLPVKIRRDPSLLKAIYKLSLELVPNADFQVNISPITSGTTTISQNRYKILMTDILVQPEWWTSTLNYYFGNFSEKKAGVLSKASGFTLDQIGAFMLANNYDAIRSIARTTQIYLNYQLFTGHPELEDNGLNMTMGAAVN